MKKEMEIRNWITQEIIYSAEAESMRELVETAVKKGINLKEANLAQANLKGATLERANLKGANLEGATLWGANLKEANLKGANLWGANLKGATLWGANLQGIQRVRLYWHIHHDVLVEVITEPIKRRKDYIRKDKPKEEIATRLRLLKKVKAEFKDLPTTKEGWEKLHRQECPNCPWNGETIFPEGK